VPERSLDEILKDDKTLRRFIEINIEVLSNIAKIGYGVIEHIPIKDGKLLVKKQTLHIDGAE
jgi:hypothetical protein